MDHLAALVSAITALVIAVTGLLAMIIRLWFLMKRGDAKTDKRVDLIWSRDISRGEMAVQKIDTRSLEAAFAPIAPALRRIKYDLPDATAGELAEAIEDRMGEWITRHICGPLHVKDYMCLAIALQVASSEGPSVRNHNSPWRRVKPAPMTDIATPAKEDTAK
jgi:hypothetical protein